jgi:hypothetical protein
MRAQTHIMFTEASPCTCRRSCSTRTRTKDTFSVNYGKVALILRCHAHPGDPRSKYELPLSRTQHAPPADSQGSRARAWQLNHFRSSFRPALPAGGFRAGMGVKVRSSGMPNCSQQALHAAPPGDSARSVRTRLPAGLIQ